MENIAQLGIKVDSSGIKSATTELTNLSNQSGKTEQKTQSLVSSVAKLAGSYIALSQAMDAGRYFLKTADAMTLVDSRLKLATNSAESFAKAQQELYNISQLTRTQLTSTVDLFERMTRSTRDYNLSQDELLGITQTINKAMIISGGTAESMNASIIQLGQALSADFKGVGQELASIREQTPRLYQALLDGTNKSADAFRKLAEEGKLSTKIIIDALKSQGISVDAEFLKINKTVAQSQIQVSNAMGILIKNFNDMTGLTEGLAEGFTTLSENINSISSEDIQKYIDLTKTVGSLAASLGGAILVFSTYNKVAGIASTLSIAYAASLNTVNAAILLTAASTKILNAALKASPLGVVAGAIYLLSESFTDAKTRSDNLSVSVKTLANDLSVLDAKSRLVDVNKQLKEMDDRFKNYSETQKLMYKGAYDLQYKEKLQLEGVIKLSEEKNELIKKGEDELKKNATTTTEISDNLKNMLDPVQAIKNKYIEYRKELEKSGNATKENLEKLKQLEQSDLEALSKKLNKTEDLEKANKKLEEAEKARNEIAQIGMNGYEKSLTSINEKYQSWIEAGVDINTALSAQKQLVDELNAQTLSETLLEDLSYYERKVQLQSDSLAKELELQGIAYSNAVLNIENSDKTIEQKERLIALETELYDLSIAKLEEDSNTEFQDTLLEFQDEALERQQELNSAIYDFGNGFEDAGNKISKVAKSLAAMANAEIKSKKEREKLDKKYTKEFDKYAGDVEKTKKVEQEYSKETAQINEMAISNQIDGYSALAGAIAGLYEEGSSKAKQWLEIQKILSVVSGVVAIASAMANGDGYTAVARGLAVAATLVSFGWSKGGGGGASVPSVADTAQENLDFENTLITDRLDRQIELLEELNLQGSAAKLQVQSAGLQFDYEKATSVNNIRKVMEENVEKWGGQNSLNTFNGQISSFGFKGDLLDYFSKESPEKLWLNYSKKTVGGLANWMSQYIDITDRQFMEMRNEFQNKMSDFAINVIGTINNLKDTGKDLKETYDELTDSQKYANMDLMNAIKQVDTLRGERSFANYIEDEIHNITKLEQELTADRISLLLSEDIADMRAKVDLINYLSDQTGMAFENGAEDVLNYIDAIEAVSEMMTTSRDNIKSYLDSFKTSEQLLQDLADTLNLKVANSVEELNLLFNQLSSDIYGLTDAELEFLNANKDYLESIEELSTSTSSSTENIKNFIDSLKTSDELLFEMSNTLGINVATSAEDLADVFQKLAYDIDGLSDTELDYLNKNKKYIEQLQKAKIDAFNEELSAVGKSISSIESIMNTLDSTIMKFRTDTMGSSYTLSSFYESMKKTLELSNSDDFDALSDSLKDTISYSAALFDSANFSSEAEMKYAQQVAANEFESMNLTLDTELDVLKEIEINTRAQVDAITESISALNANLLALIGGKTNTTQIPTAPNRTLEEIISSIPDNTKSTGDIDLNSLLEVGLDPRKLTTDKNYVFSESQIAAWTPEAQKADALWKVQDAYTRILGETPTQNALDVFSERYLSGELGTSKDLYQTIAVEAIYNGYKADEAQDYLNKVGIRGFANGGIITAPTLGLIGEAGYSEAVIPLKNPNDPLNQAALIGEVRALRSEVAYLNTLNEKQTATQIKTLSETRMIKGLSA